MKVQTPQTAIESLWKSGFFKDGKTFPTIKKELNRNGINFQNPRLHTALCRAGYLVKKSSRGKYSFIQQFAADEIQIEDNLPVKLVKDMGVEFETEVADLKNNYGKSGTCTAFLLRKILEKLLFLSFAKNGMGNKMKKPDGSFVTLRGMLNLATANNANGIPFLMPKTATQIEGIKFLGDTSAHNPLVNVEMKTILPQMPFIITAYQELVKKI